MHSEVTRVAKEKKKNQERLAGNSKMLVTVPGKK